MTELSGSATILIVDDTEQNVRLLAHVVKKEGYDAIAAFSGEDALEMVDTRKPDIILLDVMMPEMDGFEVCRRLKESEEVADVPVIFLSALQETDSKVKGFEVGGVDYITKPFQREEVLARIRLHLKLTRLQNQLEENIEVLREREQRLNRLNQEKDELMRIVGHDIRNPVTGIIGISDLLIERIDEMDQEEREHMLKTMQDSGNKILKLVNGLLKKETAERGIADLQLEEIRLDELIQGVIDLQRPLALTKNISFQYQNDGDPSVEMDKQKMDQVIGNLLSNALKFTLEGGEISIEVNELGRGDDRYVEIIIQDNGIGIPREEVNSLFQDSGDANVRSGTSGEVGSGMGLNIVKQFTELHDGSIEVQSEEGEGTTFTIYLPVKQQNRISN